MNFDSTIAMIARKINLKIGSKRSLGIGRNMGY